MLPTLLARISGNISYPKRCFSQKRSFKEVAINVPWGYICGKWWEPYDMRPILAVHGWQDNCGSFDRLIPLLSKDVGFLAIDFPGHGYSSRLPLGIEYTDNLYLMTVAAIKSKMNWPKVSLMGHSLGSISMYTYAMLFNDIVDFTIHIDALKPLIQETEIRKYLEANMINFFKYNAYLESGKEPPSYTLGEIKTKICTLHSNSIDLEHCDHLVERHIASSKLYPGKFYFTRDSRLKALNFPMWSQQQLVSEAKCMKKPLFLVKCKDSSYFEKKENMYEVLEVIKKTSADCDFHYVEGKHHTHLNNPERMSDLINSFISKHLNEDRTINGLQSDIVVEQRAIRSFAQI